MANVIYTVPLADEALSLNSNIGNVIITGGNANFVITTDGTGNLSFVDPTTIGLSGYSGISGYSGKADRYLTTSTTSLTIATGTQTLTVDTGLAYSPSQSITIANNSTNYMTGEVTTYATGNGQLVANVTTTVGSGTYTSWTINLAGATGAQGASGTSGYSGNQGVSGFSGFSGRSGTSGISGTSGRSGTSGLSGRSGVSGAIGLSGYSGYSGISGISGTSGVIGSSGYSGQAGPSNIINATLDTSTTILYPVMVGATGSDQIAKGTALVYNSTTGNLHANLLTGTLTTAAQPNITSVGTLGNLTVTNPIVGSVTGSAGTAGTVTTAAQPNITSLGTLTGLTVNGYANITQANLSGNANISALYIPNGQEKITVNTSLPPSVDYDIATQSILYYTSNVSTNWSVNFRASNTTTLNNMMATNSVMTVTLITNMGPSGYYANAHSIDGTTVTVNWLGNATISGGIANSKNVYSYSIIKTAANTYTVLGSLSQFT